MHAVHASRVVFFRFFLRGWLHGMAPRRCPAIGNYAVIPTRRAQQDNQAYIPSVQSEGVRLASTSSLYVYAFSPPTCESQYVVGSVKNSPCLQRGRIASSLTLMPRPGPVGTGM